MAKQKRKKSRDRSLTITQAATRWGVEVDVVLGMIARKVLVAVNTTRDLQDPPRWIIPKSEVLGAEDVNVLTPEGLELRVEQKGQVELNAFDGQYITTAG